MARSQQSVRDEYLPHTAEANTPSTWHEVYKHHNNDYRRYIRPRRRRRERRVGTHIYAFLLAAFLILRRLYSVSFQIYVVFLYVLILWSCSCCCVLVPGTLAFPVLPFLNPWICDYFWCRFSCVSQSVTAELVPGISLLSAAVIVYTRIQ